MDYLCKLERARGIGISRRTAYELTPTAWHIAEASTAVTRAAHLLQHRRIPWLKFCPVKRRRGEGRALTEPRCKPQASQQKVCGSRPREGW